MADVRIHRYVVDTADVEEFVSRRAALIGAVRERYAGLAETRLIRLEDGGYADIWRWDTAEHMRAAAPVATLPEASAAMSLTRDSTAENGEIVDEL